MLELSIVCMLVAGFAAVDRLVLIVIDWAETRGEKK